MGALRRERGNKDKQSVLSEPTADLETNQRIYAYELEVGSAKTIKKRLPQGASFAIVSRKLYPASKFGTSFKVKKGVAFYWAGKKLGKKSAKKAEKDVSADAFQPSARARALLRGVKLVEEDLKSSGGAYSLAQVQELMRGISRQAINSRVHDGTLLAVSGPSNRAVYPTVQFLQDGMPVDGLKAVRDSLGTSNPWMLLNFLVTAEPKLGQRKPIELLKAGKIKDVVEVARRVGHQGA